MTSQEGPLTGAESFLVGLSPGYWSHVPLSIADIIHMKVVAGVTCILLHPSNGQNLRCFPVSKCLLVGVIVYASTKANNSHCYVIDDGTGWMDCLKWGQSPESLYYLPELACENHKASELANPEPPFRVGDRVRILGRLECVCVSETKQDVGVGRLVLEVRDCIHEVHASSIELLAPFETSNELNWEANHWMKSIQATKPATSQNKMGLRNGVDTLEWLGPKIRNEVEKRCNFPSASDSLGAWRVFGVACTCDLSYQQHLLYCHCQATTEALDPNFTFRDALLQCLLEMEKDLCNNQHTGGQLDLRFQYHTIVHHKELGKVAARVVSTAERPDLKVPMLINSTVRALRRDGILSLLDEKSDTYLLLSRPNVLEPYIRRCHQRRLKHQRPPFYLQNVPQARLLYVKRYCFAEGD